MPKTPQASSGLSRIVIEGWESREERDIARAGKTTVDDQETGNNTIIAWLVFNCSLKSQFNNGDLNQKLNSPYPASWDIFFSLSSVLLVSREQSRYIKDSFNNRSWKNFYGKCCLHTSAHHGISRSLFCYRFSRTPPDRKIDPGYPVTLGLNLK